jgi:hypothetical protein
MDKARKARPDPKRAYGRFDHPGTELHLHNPHRPEPLRSTPPPDVI